MGMLLQMVIIPSKPYMEELIMSVLSELSPKNVFKYFEEICAIPHGSRNTLAISNYLVHFAVSHNYRYIQDSYNNVIIFKPGTSGYESSPAVIIQGHIDMVCEKEPGSDFDFEKDGLKLCISDNMITAQGTTLGGDDGIAVAYALAILDSDDIPHPPIEAVFTVDEEIGMLGATALDCSPLTSRIMLNIDSEEEGHILVSCAGGATASCQLPVSYIKEEPTTAIVRIKAYGIIGGHSGVEIIKQGANASKVLGRALYNISNQIDFNIASITGGSKDNVIPKESEAIISIKAADDLSLLSDIIKEINIILSNEYSVSDPDIEITCEALNPEAFDNMVMTKDDTRKVIYALNILPNGIMKMSHDIEGLVQTSLNLGIMNTERKTSSTGFVHFGFSVRSSIKTEKDYLIDTITCIMNTLGGDITISGEYPAWEYKKESPLRQIMTDVYKEQYGKEPVIEALHAGLECGIFSDKLKGLDCVSFGPDITDIHTVKEALSIESVNRTWNYLIEVLRRLK